MRTQNIIKSVQKLLIQGSKATLNLAGKHKLTKLKAKKDFIKNSIAIEVTESKFELSLYTVNHKNKNNAKLFCISR